MDLLNADVKTLLPMGRMMGNMPKVSDLQKSSAGSNQTATDEALMKTAKDFESVFIAEMMKPMWEGIQTNAPFGGGQAEDIYRSMMIDEYAKQLSNNGGVGIADAVYKELLAIQGDKK